MRDDAIAPSWVGVAWSAVPLAASMALLAWQRLGQVRPMAIGVVRLVLQLWLLGLFLNAVFATESLRIVLGTAAIMLGVAAHTVGTRQPATRWLVRLEALIALGLGVLIPMAVSVTLSLRLHPWYSPTTFVPLFGMILGHSVSGVSLAAERLASELKLDRDLVEQRLALGATSRHAAMPALRSAVRVALTPLINNMMIAGIVSVPGMATGAILAGSGVGDAMRYQMMIYFAFTATATLSTLIVLGLRLRRYFTPAHQLREY